MPPELFIENSALQEVVGMTEALLSPLSAYLQRVPLPNRTPCYRPAMAWIPQCMAALPHVATASDGQRYLTQLLPSHLPCAKLQPITRSCVSHDQPLGVWPTFISADDLCVVV